MRSFPAHPDSYPKCVGGGESRIPIIQPDFRDPHPQKFNPSVLFILLHILSVICSRQGLARPPRSSFDGRSTFVRLFVHHYFTLPLGPVRLAFTQFHKSFDLHYVIHSTLKIASNAHRIHKTIVRLVRRSSCRSTLFHHRKKTYVSHSSQIFSALLTCITKKTRFFRSSWNNDMAESNKTMTADKKGAYLLSFCSDKKCISKFSYH